MATPKVVTTGTREEMLANATKLAEGIKKGLADKNTKLTSKQRDSFSKQLGGATTTLSRQAPQTITADSLKQTPVTTLTQPPTALQTTGMIAEMAYNATATNDAYNQNLQNQQATALAGKTEAGNAYKDFLANLQGSTGLTSDAYSQKGGVDQIQTELNDINNQILAEQNALINKTQKLEKNAEGMFAGALQDQLQDVERESLRKQADLSIIQMGVQGRYDSAKAIADRAVSAYLEKQSILNETLKFNYEESKDLWSTAEQRAFESAQADRERKLAQDREDMTAIRNLAIDAQRAGASTATVQAMLSSKTLEEAMGKTGGVFAPKPTVPKRDTQVVDGKLIDMQTGEIISTLGAGVQDEEQQTQINDTLSLARELLDAESVGKGEAVGASWQKFVPFGMSLGLQGERTAFENKVNTLKANLTLPNLSLLKGPMSDKDIAFLQAIGSSITTNMSEDEFDKQLRKVVEKFEGKLSTGNNIITAPDGLEIQIID